jgi:hypothetical protein
MMSVLGRGDYFQPASVFDDRIASAQLDFSRLGTGTTAPLLEKIGQTLQ